MFVQEGASNRDLLCCDVDGCGAHYHRACLRRMQLVVSTDANDDTAFMCPLHTCDGCKSSCRATQSARCLRCPMAYHHKCAPPEVVEAAQRAGIWPHYMVCDRHTAPGGRGLRGPWPAEGEALSEEGAARVLQALSGGKHRGLRDSYDSGDESEEDSSDDEGGQVEQSQTMHRR